MMKTRYFISLFFLFSLFLAAVSAAEPIGITASVSDGEVKPGEEVILTLSASESVDAYYFSSEVVFDPETFAFIGAEAVGLTSGGLAIGDLIRENRIGSSVSRTTPLAEPSSGALMQLRFRALTYAPTGEHSFRFEELVLGDSSHEDLETVDPEPIMITVLEAVSYLSITSPASFEVEEGSSFMLTASLFANGVTVSEGNEGRLQVWAGVYDQNSDPREWPEASWQLMEFTEISDGHYIYEGDVAFGKSVGVHYIAIRAELDSESVMKYGGTGGLWHPDDNPSAVMEILQQPPFRYTIAAWDFDDETFTTSAGLPQNFGAEVEIFNASLSGSGFVAGASGRAANSSGWNNFDEAPGYWQVIVSTEGLSQIRVSSKQSGTNTGPRDFQLQYSTDGSDWSDVAGGAITVANNFTTGVLDEVPLPSDASDLESLWLRWIQTSDISINENGVSATGTNRIDDIVITGINPDPQRVFVWPGDTNNDGVVNEEDVLPLALWWGTSGPQPIYRTTAWGARESEEWIPGAATYADANGDGIINHLDLRPVGSHFGQTRSGSLMMEKGTPLAMSQLRSLRMGEEITLYISLPEHEKVTGLSFHIEGSGIGREEWEVSSVQSPEWIDDWRSENRLLEFSSRTATGEAVALAHMGFTKPVAVSNLAELTIRANRDWTGEPVFRITRMTLSSNDHTENPKNVTIETDPTDLPYGGGTDEVPPRTVLHQNFPNPFNPTTMISYSISEPSEVRIDIYNSLGRRVATLVEANQQAGNYTVPFDASALSSGIYYYRMRANGQAQMRSMTLVK